MSTSTQSSPAALDSTPPQSKSFFQRNASHLLETAGRLAALAVVITFFAFKVPKFAFLTPDNFENVAMQSAVYIMCGLGMTMIMISGGIDLAAGSSIALSMVLTALILDAGRDTFDAQHHLIPGALTTHPIMWTELAMLGGAGAAVMVGLLQGVLITGLRLVPFIVTLGGMLAIRGLTKLASDSHEIVPPDTNLLYTHLMARVQPSDGFDWRLFPPGVWATLIAAILAAGMLRYTKLGRRIYAIGSSEATARLCGIPVVRTKIMVYAIAGLFTGMAGVLEFSKHNMGQPTGAVSYELYVIAACVIGGTSLMGGVGTIFGTVIGALMIGTLNAGVQQADWPKPTQEIAIGLIIVVAVALDGLRPRRG